jgi:hypothetical protein
MNPAQFEDTLRQFLHHEPFVPFVIELVDGQCLFIDSQGLAFGGGAAAYLSASYELHTFTCEQVRSIRSATHETAL